MRDNLFSGYNYLLCESYEIKHIVIAGGFFKILYF